MIELGGKRVYVVGLGTHGTGRQLTQVLARRRALVTVADLQPAAQLAGELTQMEGIAFTAELGEDYGRSIAGQDLVVISPAVPLQAPPLVRARQAGVPVIGELELAYLICRAPIVAITGTKGKTTTTTLTGRLLADAGRAVRVGGNIGDPLVGIADQASPEELVVAEVSSFQLEATERFQPRVGVLLNVYEDHLDRHGSPEAYLAAKARLFANQRPEEVAVLNADEPAVAALAPRLRARVLRYGLGEALAEEEGAVTVREGQFGLVAGGAFRPICPVGALRLPGRHNLSNALAAISVLVAVGAPREGVERTLRGFSGVPHRLEPVGEVGGVLFVNDSQATCKQAVCYALEAYAPRRTVLIAGGRAKVPDFSDLAPAIVRWAQAVVLIGEAAPQLEQAVRALGMEQVIRAESLPEAVAVAYRLAQPEGVVLLSPACASFDMFQNMEHRGQLFREAVAELAAQGERDAA